MQRSTRPLTAAERAELESPIYRRPPGLLGRFIFGVLWIAVGGVLATPGWAGFLILAYFSLAGKIFIALTSAFFVAAGLVCIVVGLRRWASAFPRHPVLVREARELSGAIADTIRFDIVQTWTLHYGDDDVAPPHILLLPNGKFVLLTLQEIGDAWIENRGTLRERLTISRLGEVTIECRSDGAEVPDVGIEVPDWIDEVLRLEPEVELDFNQLPPPLQSIIRPAPVTPNPDQPDPH